MCCVQVDSKFESEIGQTKHPVTDIDHCVMMQKKYANPTTFLTDMARVRVWVKAALTLCGR